MKDWPAIWTFISTVLALAVAWGFTQASALLTVRQADNRILKEALYYLLELHYQLAGIQRLDKASSAYVTIMFGEHAEDLTPEMHSQMAKAFQPMIRKAINPIVVERLAGIKDGYQACLLKLATVDPLNASLLRGQEELLGVIDRMVSVLENPEAHGISSPASTTEQVAKFRQYFEDKMLPRSSAVLLRVIQELAQTIGGTTQKRLTATLAKREKLEAELEKEIRDFLADITTVLT